MVELRHIHHPETTVATFLVVMPETDFAAPGLALDLRDDFETRLPRGVSFDRLEPLILHAFARNRFAFENEIRLGRELIERKRRPDDVSQRRLHKPYEAQDHL